MNKDALSRRYTSLWTGETVSAALFASLLIWYAYRDGQWQHWVARIYSLGVVIFILIQGVFWWRWKLHVLKQGKRTLPSYVLRRYRLWRTINWWLICAFPLVVFGGAALTGQPVNSVDTWLGLLFLGGAILEQVNYYYVQLMYNSLYDWRYLKTNGRLRPGTVAKALRQEHLES
ncbi:MAG: hypothetical protein IPM53_12165 [Anaerolineaceae bacterium]|nr:hypothetical protein [Anaerolineaceae bacterium]